MFLSRVFGPLLGQPSPEPTVPPPAPTVGMVMTPRREVAAIRDDTDSDALVALFVESGYSRILLFGETLDDAYAYVHVKDVLRAVAARHSFDVRALARRLPVLAPSLPVPAALEQFRQGHVHIAGVVDEFGGLDGVVTLENLVEAAIGAIEDESDAGSVPHEIELPDGAVLFEGDAPVSRLLARIPSVTAEPHIRTVGGLVLAVTQIIPGPGARVRLGPRVSAEVMAVDRQRIDRVLVRVEPDEGGGAAG
jgi:magnesium and cobalt transporter